MHLSVSETAKLSGVSVRTLHYYDQIGLLCPTDIKENGYRVYDQTALYKLQQILFYRELDFKLKDIADMMNASHYQKEDALIRQRELLKMKRQRLDGLIALLDASIEGEETMNFKAFDTQEIEKAKAQYAEEVKEKWQGTAAYTQCQEKTSKYQKEDWQKIMTKSNEIMKAFAALVDEAPDSAKVQELVADWRNFITASYYECTKEILAGLGQMYVLDERFKKNIDQFGPGTAQLMSEAIKVYCAQ